LAETIKVRLHMAEYLLNEDIANLYERIRGNMEHPKYIGIRIETLY